MKKTIFLLFLVLLSSCNEKKPSENNINTNTESVDESTVSQKHDESLWWFCACSSCMWIEINQKDEFIL